jgi:2-polyprenyl-6-methoxyphenol hydroxylase-like FAD-dependent oxidoreductase
MHNHLAMIVGAGPVGLGAALFLTRQGQAVRVVEMREEPAPYARALAVNPRTLEILEPTGVTALMLERGLPIRGVQFSRGSRRVASISLDSLHPRYPFMLALSQATTERLLAEALTAAGGSVQRGVTMVECQTLPDSVEVTLEPSAGGDQERVRGPWLLAADGSHSVARQQLHVEAPGSSLAHEWHLADLPLRTDLAADQAHVLFLDRGAFVFLLRVVDDLRQEKPGPALWRVFGNRPELLSLLTNVEPAGPPVWTSRFHIAHRIDATLAAGHVYFAGDAAHVHSPAGARGMNLGLEDAWVFAELVRTNRLEEYNRLRRPVDRQVVRQVELLSRVVAAESPFYRLLRALAFPLVLKLPFLRSRMMATIAGLDHPLEPIGRKAA